MHAAIGIDHALSFIGMHARRTHVVPGTFALPAVRPALGKHRWPGVDLGHADQSQFLRNQCQRAVGRMSGQGIDAPVNLDPWHAKCVTLRRRQGDAAVGVGCRLDDDLKADAADQEARMTKPCEAIQEGIDRITQHRSYLVVPVPAWLVLVQQGLLDAEQRLRARAALARKFRTEAQACIEHALAGHRFGCQRKLGSDMLAMCPHCTALVVVLDVIQLVARPAWSEMHTTCLHARMVHEKAANQPATIADATAHGLVRCQQQPRILDAASGQHEQARRYRHRLAIQGLYPYMIDARTGMIGQQRRHVRMQENPHIRSALQLLAVMAAEAYRRAELGHGVAYPPAAQGDAAHIGAAYRLLPESRIEVQRAQLQDLVRAFVIRHQLLEPEWPAAMRHPIASLEIPGIERPAPAAPAIAAATEETCAATICEFIGHASGLAAIQVAGRIIRLEAAAFKHTGIDAMGVELAREGKAGNAATDNADGGHQCAAIIDLPGVNEHGRWHRMLESLQDARCARPASPVSAVAHRAARAAQLSAPATADA